MGQMSNFHQGPIEMKFEMDGPSKYVKYIFEVLQGH